MGLSDELFKIGDQIHRNKLAKGWTVTTPESWADENQIPADLALIHSEVSEALEAFRRDARQEFADELADVAIRLVGLADGLKIDLGAAIAAKIARNAMRPAKHGNKRI